MSRPALKVTFKPATLTRIPDFFTEAAAIVMRLAHRGVLDLIGQHLKIRRQGGYCGLDVYVMLVVYFATSTLKGIRPFWKKLRPVQKKVAALAGRRSLTSPSSLSRALSRVEVDLLREATPHLLMDIADTDALLRHPAVLTYDAHGNGWHLFDIDPTNTTLRHRALPVEDELPEPTRDSADTGARGFSARKRGEMQFRRTTVQHAGSGLYPWAHLSEGNGDARVDLPLALDSIVATCERLDHPLERVMARFDGEWGNVPGFWACRQRKMPFVTRLNRKSLYTDPVVLRALNKATFHRVPDSLSGPRRSAADLGRIRLTADQRTTKADGSAFEPIELRVVASIYPKAKDDGAGRAVRGQWLDGWRVELFAADALDASAWPAPDVVAAYFGRNGQENRFAQEDRELGLDRIVSYHLPGQELASVVGLSLWNLRVVAGFASAPPPAVVPVAEARQDEVDERVPSRWPLDPVVKEVLTAQDWEQVLGGRGEGWSFDAARAELNCPAGQPLTLATVRPQERALGRTNLIFRRPKGGCRACEQRSGCLASTDLERPKHAEVTLESEAAEAVRERLAQVRGKAVSPKSPPLVPIDAPSGPLAIAEALFLPAAARHAFTDLFEGVSFRVHLEVDEPQPPQLKLVADDVADRQRRRKTWEDNLARYALDEEAELDLEVSGGEHLRGWLSLTEQHGSRLERRG